MTGGLDLEEMMESKDLKLAYLLAYLFLCQGCWQFTRECLLKLGTRVTVSAERTEGEDLYDRLAVYRGREEQEEATESSLLWR